MALLLVGGGCLLPYPEDLPPLPEARNRAPRIEERNVTPSRIVNLSAPDDCAQALQFTLPVADPDAGDTLTVFWFVDFDPAARGGEPPIRKVDTIAPNAAGRQNVEVRDDFASWELRLNTPGSPVALPGTHLVEAYVADAPLEVAREDGLWVIRPSTPTSPPTDGGLPDQPYMTSYAWFVTTPQGCPQEAP